MISDGDFPTLVSKDRVKNALDNVIFVQSSNGTSAAVIPGTGATDLGKAVDSVGGATDTGVAALAIRDDVLTTLTPVDGDYVRLRTNSLGALHVTGTSFNSDDVHVDDSAFTIGTDSVSASGYLADETTPDSVDEGDVGLARMTLDRKQLVRIVGSSDGNRLEIDSNGDIDVANILTSVTPGVAAGNLGKAEDAVAGNGDTGVMILSVRRDTAATSAGADLDYATINTNSTGDVYTTLDDEIVLVSRTTAANSELNPIFVQNVTTAVSGEEVHDFDTQAALASDTNDNHDYTVVGTTFLLRSVIFSASGSVRAEIQTGPVATLATVAVGFTSGEEGGTQQLFFDPPVEVPVTSTGTVRVIRRNREDDAQDVYSTIIGSDV